MHARGLSSGSNGAKPRLRRRGVLAVADQTGSALPANPAQSY
jgi:hypothetical protein